MFSIDLSPAKEFKKFFEPLPRLINFVLNFALAAIPINIFMSYPQFYNKYEYLSSVFFFWVIAGGFSWIITSLIHPGTSYQKENDPVFFFRNFLLFVFWVFTIFSPVTNSAYKNGHQLSIEQTGRCDLVNENEFQVCLDRKKELIQNSGVFSVVSGELKGDGKCYLKLLETLPSGLLRKATLEASSDFCQKVKITDSVILTSKLQERGKPCEGYVKNFVHGHAGDMDIQVCTSYSLIAK